MSKKPFNPLDWQDENETKSTLNNLSNLKNLNVHPANEIEHLTRKIEAAAVDIAPNYAGWRDLGFALADALGENGRNYYHRISRFYPNYNKSETDKQFDNCLKSHGHGITIKTFFHLSKSAGIDVSIKSLPAIPTLPTVPTVPTVPFVPNRRLNSLGVLNPLNPLNPLTSIPPEDPDSPPCTGLPTIPESVYKNLPAFLLQATAKAISPEDKDLLLLGSIVAVSPCLPNIYGVYDERNVYPNLFLFVTAQASAGKGRLTLCRKLVEPIHQALREQNKAEQEEYKRLQTEYAAAKDKTGRERPQDPPLRALFIPANSSATALFQILNDNNGIGLMFETEGDTLAQTFKSEHGNYSDGFRKAFHHEKISYLRRKDREYVELETPRLSALLSGTPKQVSALIPNAENGLFSRFIFYCMNILPVWKNVFTGNTDQTLDDYFHQLGNQFFDFYKTLQQLPQSFRFSLTTSQQDQFNAYFSQIQNQYLYLYGTDYLATVRRLALITFRIAMILTTLRLIDAPLNPLNNLLLCSTADFNIALEIVKILIQHASKIYEVLPAEIETHKQPNQKQLFLEALPTEFSRQDYLSVAKHLEIPDKTAEKHIAKFTQNGLINHFAHDKYKKT